jgi:hypothetical protein
MSDREFNDGDEFETPDGTVSIVGIARNNDGRIVYRVKYHDVVGEPVSPLAQDELKNNPDISKC